MSESSDKVIYDPETDLYKWQKGTRIKLSDHFSTHEFEDPTDNVQQISKLLVDKLEAIRKVLKVPMKVTSGYRSPAYQENLRKRGFPTTPKGKVSQHELGRAVDIICSKRAELLEYASQQFMAIGVGKTFIHMDLRDDKKRRWFYS